MSTNQTDQGAIVITTNGTTSYIYFDCTSNWFAITVFPLAPLSDGRFAYKDPPTEETALTGTTVFNSRTDNEQHIKRIA